MKRYLGWQWLGSILFYGSIFQLRTFLSCLTLPLQPRIPPPPPQCCSCSMNFISGRHSGLQQKVGRHNCVFHGPEFSPWKCSILSKPVSGGNYLTRYLNATVNIFQVVALACQKLQSILGHLVCKSISPKNSARLPVFLLLMFLWHLNCCFGTN